MSENAAGAGAKDKEVGTSSKKKSGSTDASLNLDEIRELAELVNEHGFTDFEFENENIRVRLSKAVNQTIVQPLQQMAPPPAGSTVSVSSPQVQEQPAPEAEDDVFKINSPIVGTFYRSPGPEKDPYVKEGSQVVPETVVCIVEAMKLMNEIQAETTGEVVAIYVENGQPVEFGQPLFGLRK
jgi:acetyl-CoA carboxylase biotin carboxyl carrier protein